MKNWRSLLIKITYQSGHIALHQKRHLQYWRSLCKATLQNATHINPTKWVSNVTKAIETMSENQEPLCFNKNNEVRVVMLCFRKEQLIDFAKQQSFYQCLSESNKSEIDHSCTVLFFPCLCFYPMVFHMVKVFNEAVLPVDNEVHKKKMIPKSNSKSHFTWSIEKNTANDAFQIHQIFKCQQMLRQLEFFYFLMEFQFDPEEPPCVTAALQTPLESAFKFLQTRRITTAFTLASWLQDHSQVKN